MMEKTKHFQTLVIGVTLILMAWGIAITPGNAQGTADPAQVVDDYLTSLVNGNAQALSALIDGRMKSKSRALTLDPDSYALFLKKHYAGVQTTIEEIIPDGERVLARVRFDYPSSDTSVVELVLTQVGGQWKVTDEAY